MLKSTRAQAGITLFEVLLASTVLVIAVTALYALYGQSLRALKYANESAAANLYLRMQMDQLRNLGWTMLTGTNTTYPTSIIPDPSTDLNLKILPKVVSQTLTVYPSSYLTGGTSYYFTVSRSGLFSSYSKSTVPATTGSQTNVVCVLNVTWASMSGTFTRGMTSVIYNSNLE